MAWGTGVNLIGEKGETGTAGTKGEKGETGATGAEGAAGADGKTILNGAGPPEAGVGNVGDFYIDTTNHKIYGPKS